MPDAALVAARFVHFASATGLFGLSLFPLYAGRAASGPRVGVWLIGLAVLSLASAWAWLFAAAAAMAGELSLDALTTVVTDMSFGHVWALRLILGIVLIAATASRRPNTVLLSSLSAASLAAIALTGHAQAQTGLPGGIHIVADGLHLLGAGVWLGGLIGLALMLRTADWTADAVAIRARMVARFSRMAVIAVAILVASGLANAVILIGAPDALWRTGYGRLLALKILLVFGMLGLAAFNRQVLTPRLEADRGAASRALARHVLAEQLLGLGVLLAVAILGQMQPPAMAG